MQYYEDTTDVTLTESEITALHFILLAEIDRQVALLNEADSVQSIETINDRLKSIYNLKAKIVGDRVMGMPIE